MQLTIDLKDLKVNSTVKAIESLIGERSITLPIAVIPQGAMSNRTYLRINFNYIIKQLITEAENNKERKRFNQDVQAVVPPVSYVPDPDLITVT